MDFTILHFDELESTNTEALNQAKRGAGEGLCIVARRQTGGRGRHGRVWISEKDAGLYFSVVLRPKIEIRFLPLITLMTAVAVFETLKQLGVENLDIKWANDVQAGGRKLSGILAETCETNVDLAVVVGVGINLSSSNLPPELREIATSIEAETNQIPDAEKLLQTLTRSFSVYYDILQGAGGMQKIRAEWTQRSSYAFGKQVRVCLANETLCGATHGIEPDGALRVETETGEIKIVRAGDVEKLRENKTRLDTENKRTANS